MIKYTKLPATIETLIPRAVNYLKLHPRVVFAYLFGGLARGKLQPLSDVDIAVYLKEDARIAENKLDILGCLIDILETDEIDLVILNTADLPLVMNIVKIGYKKCLRNQ
jgi:predicted nucleotidyltransferase